MAASIIPVATHRRVLERNVPEEKSVRLLDLAICPSRSSLSLLLCTIRICAWQRPGIGPPPPVMSLPSAIAVSVVELHTLSRHRFRFVS
jgi:hypothetical protein